MSKRKRPVDPRQQAFVFFMDPAATPESAPTPPPAAAEFDRTMRELVAATLDAAAHSNVAPLKREDVALAMTERLGRRVTKAQLDQWSAPSQEDRRVPSDGLWALGLATGDWRALRFLVEASGFRMLTEQEAVCAEFGALFAVKRHIDARARELTGDMAGLVEGLMGKMKRGAQ